MKRFIISSLGAAFVLAAVAVTAGTTHAQVLFGPNGQVGIPNVFGTYTWIHPDRLNPLANIPITPPQSVPGVIGQTWLGADGKVHGNTIDPNTGDFHAFNAKRPGNGGGFLVEDDPGQPPASPGVNGVLRHGGDRPFWGGGFQRATHPPVHPPAWRSHQGPVRRFLGPHPDFAPRFHRR